MFDTPLKEHEAKVDWSLISALAGLMLIGAFFVASATSGNESSSSPAWYNQAWLRQIVWYALGMAAAAAVCLVDYRVWARWSLVIYWGTVLLLGAVLIPGIGSTHGWGARRWIDLGPLGFQPSEFAKLALILALANFLSRPRDELQTPGTFWKAIGMMTLPFVLVFKEPDLGSALILIPITLTMLYVAGVPKRHINRLIGSAGVLIALLLVDILFAPPQWQIKLEDYQRRRLLVYFGQDGVPAGASAEQRQKARREMRNYSYNVDQALISVGSGGIWGKGWRNGTQNALGYLPPAVAHNDFIFSVIAEEKGFVGSVVVLALFSVVLFSGIRIAGQARDRLGNLLAVGVVAMLFSHVFINVGMNIRLMPVTGLPLPLLSYGGSSVLSSLIATGIWQNVFLYRRAY
ncbi:MAG: rod shape-determining protein RodA [Verrucomicrobia bacterium]|nr:rod shape-determining protein RodA [Verrucomicrobiota bacterium]